MLNEHDVKQALEVLRFGKKRASEHCDTWKDSGDRGACYAHTVAPLNNVIEFFEQYLEDLKAGENV